MELRTEVLRLPLRDPFRIARDHPDDETTTVIVEIAFAGQRGLGEAAPVAYYGETAETVVAVLPTLVAAVDPLGVPPMDLPSARRWLGAATRAMDAAVGRNGAAKAGLDIALHDAVARGVGLPLYGLLGTSSSGPPTDFSLGIDAPAVVAERAARAVDFPVLKIKVGGPSDLETLELVRRVYHGRLRVDANTGWDPEEAARALPDLERLGVELIEQPFPRHRLDQLAWLQERSALPVVADESAETEDDLAGLVGVVAGVNVKLMKCGGVGPAFRMLRRATELGFRTMLGCMEETSVGIAAGAAVASLAEWVDLDGNLLLARDPFEGLELGVDKRWRPPTGPGLGISVIGPASGAPAWVS